MPFIISFLIGLMIILISVPTRTLLPSKQFKKVRLVLSEDIKQEETIDPDKAWFNKIASVGTKVNSLLKLRLSRKKYLDIENKLMRAGLKKRFTPDTFYGFKTGMLFIGGGYGLLLSVVTPVIFLKWICYSVAIICFIWPNMWLENTIRTRKMSIQREMPFVLSSIAVMTESGQSLYQGIKEVAFMKEGALVEEFRTAIMEIEMGFSRVEAFERMRDRVQVTELSVFLSSLTQSIEKGSSGISELLKKQSEEMWKKRKEDAKELAEKASIKLFLPLLVFVLPAMMIFLLTPAVLSLVEMM
ncbi:MAG: type II secretion system F family protein [Clostridia bacterium]|nr:type II secretion system F family protein [Clostridia bacterium]